MPFLDAADPFSVPNEWQQGQGQQMGMTQVSQPLQQTQQATQVQTKHRPIMAKPPTLAPIPASANRNMQAFGQNQSVGAPPASIQTLGSPFQFGHDFAKPSRSSHKHTAIVPSTIAIPSNPFPPPTRIPSPQKNYRPSVRRAASDVQKRPSKAKPAAPEVQPPPNFAGKGRYSAGTAKKPAPSKETMASIPETAKFSPRTSVTFSIDEFGRAKTETTVIIGEETSSRPRSSQRPGTAGFEDEEESTDEEMVVISSRRNSFTTSTSRDSRPREKPKTARFETTYCSRSRPRETGDATRALKRVVENRRKSISGLTAMPPSDQGATIRIQSSRDRERERERLYRRRSYGAGSAPSSNFSASPNYGMEDDDTDIDTDMVDTPATERSEATRCVCSRKERAGDEFMVLWYVFPLPLLQIHSKYWRDFHFGVLEVVC